MDRIHLETVDWALMNHIDDVEEISDNDYEVLKEIGDVIRKHGREEKFGVCLLHKHFDLEKGQRMFEETDFENKKLVSRIVSEEEYSDKDVIETAWRFSGDIETVTVCEKVCHYFLGHKQRHQRVGR